MPPRLGVLALALALLAGPAAAHRQPRSGGATAVSPRPPPPRSLPVAGLLPRSAAVRRWRRWQDAAGGDRQRTGGEDHVHGRGERRLSRPSDAAHRQPRSGGATAVSLRPPPPRSLPVAGLLPRAAAVRRWRRWRWAAQDAAGGDRQRTGGEDHVHGRGERRLSRPSDAALHRGRALLSPDLLGLVLDFAPFRFRIAVAREASSTVTLLGRSGAEGGLSHEADVVGVRFFPGGGRLLTWGADRRAIVWETATGRALREFGHEGVVACARIFPDGRRVVTCGEEGACHIRDANTGESLSTFPAPSVSDVEIFPAGDRLLSWGREARAVVWDAATGRPACELDAASVHIARVFPDGRKVVTGSLDQRAVIWDAVDCGAIWELFHSHWVVGVAVLPAGDSVATIDAADGVAVWHIESGERVRMSLDIGLRANQFLDILALPQGDRVAALNLEGVVIWNASTGDVLQRLLSAPDWFDSFALSPGGEEIVTCGFDGVAVWGARSGSKLHFMAEGSYCSFVAIGVGRALDPDGFGQGVSWRELA